MEPPMPQTATPARPATVLETANIGRQPVDRGPAPDTMDESDAGTIGDARAHPPVHLHPGFVLVVIGGGTVGALARYGLGILLPSPAGWPLPTLITNLTGALLLGLLLEALVRRGPDIGRLRFIRLLAGTGFLGAFTTYSTLALETNTLLGAGRSTDALIYVAASLIGGAVATVAGVRAAAGHHAWMTTRRRNTTLLSGQQEGSL